VLLGVGVIAFPLLFETEPRPIPVDLPIVIPPRETAPPLAMPPPASAARADAPAPVVAADPPPAAPAPEPAAAQQAEPAAGPAATPKAESRPDQTSEPQPEPKAAAAKTPPVDDGARARALLEGKAASPAPAAPAKPTGRYAVQIGAFAEAKTVREVRAKARQVGLETTTQVITVKTGEVTRIRVGPFSTREAADAAAVKARNAGLPASVLKL
jgi:DedD protein